MEKTQTLPTNFSLYRRLETANRSYFITNHDVAKLNDVPVEHLQSYCEAETLNDVNISMFRKLAIFFDIPLAFFLDGISDYSGGRSVRFRNNSYIATGF